MKNRLKYLLMTMSLIAGNIAAHANETNIALHITNVTEIYANVTSHENPEEAVEIIAQRVTASQAELQRRLEQFFTQNSTSIRDIVLATLEVTLRGKVDDHSTNAFPLKLFRYNKALKELCTKLPTMAQRMLQNPRFGCLVPKNKMTDALLARLTPAQAINGTPATTTAAATLARGPLFELLVQLMKDIVTVCHPKLPVSSHELVNIISECLQNALAEVLPKIELDELNKFQTDAQAVLTYLKQNYPTLGRNLLGQAGQQNPALLVQVCEIASPLLAGCNGALAAANQSR